jgi:stress-induced morphogen
VVQRTFEAEVKRQSTCDSVNVDGATDEEDDGSSNEAIAWIGCEQHFEVAIVFVRFDW